MEIKVQVVTVMLKFSEGKEIEEEKELVVSYVLDRGKGKTE